VLLHINLKKLLMQAVTGGFEHLCWITIDVSGGLSMQQQQQQELQQVEIDSVHMPYHQGAAQGWWGCHKHVLVAEKLKVVLLSHLCALPYTILLDLIAIIGKQAYLCACDVVA
jgi:hypothetical protein